MFIFKGMGLEHSPTISIHDCVGLNVLNMNYVYFVTTTCMFWRPVRSLRFGIKSQAPHVTPEYSRIPNPRLLTGLQNIHVSQIPGSSRDSRIYMYPKSLSLHGTPEYTCFPNPRLLTGLQNIHVSQILVSSRDSRIYMFPKSQAPHRSPEHACHSLHKCDHPMVGWGFEAARKWEWSEASGHGGHDEYIWQQDKSPMWYHYYTLNFHQNNDLLPHRIPLWVSNHCGTVCSKIPISTWWYQFLCVFSVD